MAQKSTKFDGEQNRINIDMNIGQISDKNVDVRWLRNRAIPVTKTRSPPILETFTQVSPYSQASAGATLHKNQIYRFRIPSQ